MVSSSSVCHPVKVSAVCIASNARIPLEMVLTNQQIFGIEQVLEKAMQKEEVIKNLQNVDLDHQPERNNIYRRYRKLSKPPSLNCKFKSLSSKISSLRLEITPTSKRKWVSSCPTLSSIQHVWRSVVSLSVLSSSTPTHG